MHPAYLRAGGRKVSKQLAPRPFIIACPSANPHTWRSAGARVSARESGRSGRSGRSGGFGGSGGSGGSGSSGCGRAIPIALGAASGAACPPGDLSYDNMGRRCSRLIESSRAGGADSNGRAAERGRPGAASGATQVRRSARARRREETRAPANRSAAGSGRASARPIMRPISSPWRDLELAGKQSGRFAGSAAPICLRRSRATQNDWQIFTPHCTRPRSACDRPAIGRSAACVTRGPYRARWRRGRQMARAPPNRCPGGRVPRERHASRRPQARRRSHTHGRPAGVGGGDFIAGNATVGLLSCEL